jgi:hypothetical protein
MDHHEAVAAEAAEAAEATETTATEQPTERPQNRTHSRQPSTASARRRSSVYSHRSLVVDEGQADHNAIQTGKVTSPNFGPSSPPQRPVISPLGSDTLQIPVSRGHRRNLSDGSMKSGNLIPLGPTLEEKLETK